MSGSRSRPKGLDRFAAFRWYMPGDPPDTGCWDWTGCLNNGYGFYGAQRTYVYAHAVSHELFNGPTGGLWVLHGCDRPICVQPAHLHLGNNDDNMAERELRGRGAKRARNGNAKLTEEDVEFIRTSPLKQQDVADILGVGQTTISSVRNYQTWRD